MSRLQSKQRQQWSRQNDTTAVSAAADPNLGQKDTALNSRNLHVRGSVLTSKAFDVMRHQDMHNALFYNPILSYISMKQGGGVWGHIIHDFSLEENLHRCHG